MNPDRHPRITQENGVGQTRLPRSIPRNSSSSQTTAKLSISSNSGISTLMLIAPQSSLSMELGTYYQLQRRQQPTMLQCSRFRRCRLCSTRHLSFNRPLPTTIHTCMDKIWALLTVLMEMPLAMSCRHNLGLPATRALPSSYRLTRAALATKECK